MNGVRSVGLGRGSAPGAPDPFGLWLGRGSGAPSAEPRIRKRLQTPLPPRLTRPGYMQPDG